MTSVWAADKKYSDRERWIQIYPAYINSKKTVAEGRCIELSKCVVDPSVEEIRDVLEIAGFRAAVERKKIYPRERNKEIPLYKGRVRTQLRNDDGTPVRPEFPNKKKLLRYIGERIPKLKSRIQNKGLSEASQSAQNVPKKFKKKKKKV